MAPTVNSSSDTPIKDEAPSLTPSTSAEERSLQGTFRKQYHSLHRSRSIPNNNVGNLKNKFEKQENKEAQEVKPKPKVQLVQKVELARQLGKEEQVEEVVKEELKEEEKELAKQEELVRKLSEQDSGDLQGSKLDDKVQVVENLKTEEQIILVEETKVVNDNVQSNNFKKENIPVPRKRLGLIHSLGLSSATIPGSKKVLKSVSDENDTKALNEPKKSHKRVSFSFESTATLPIPKPRLSVPGPPPTPIQQVIVETSIIIPEKVSKVETVILNESRSDLDKIEFADPEDQHLPRSHDEYLLGSVENIKRKLDAFTMDTKKKRSPSFRSKILTIFSKDKDKKPKDKDDNKKTKKTENAVFADNAQNENFNRHSAQRHTLDTPRRGVEPKQNHMPNHQQRFHEEMHPDQKDVENRYAAMHIQHFQSARNTFDNTLQQQMHHQSLQQQQHQQLLRKVSQDHGVYNPNEDYVCMDNKNDAKNYINLPSLPNHQNIQNLPGLPNLPKYDSSSTNTIESENSTTSVNPLQQIQQERLAIRSKFFNDTGTPPRAQETNQNVQLVNPKAAIPINSERPLPNPYQQPSPQPRNQSPYQQQQRMQMQDDNDLADSGYGTVYDRNSRPMSAGSSDISAGSMSSPRSPSVERTKLKLPQNREKIDLQPRIKSPIPPNEVSTDKLIATELLKTNKKNDKRDMSSPSHQKLQLEIDYPELHETICDVVDQASVTSGRDSRNANQNLGNQVNELSITSFNKNDVSSSSFNVTDNMTTMNSMASEEISRETLLEAGDWHRVQRDLASSPSLKNVQITTNALVHVDSPHRTNTPSQDGRSRSITPIMMGRRNSITSLQRSPPKQEIRQTVEAFCWKELKKLKEKEEHQMQMLVGPMVSSCGYAEDPIRRSRSMAVTPRDTRRSTSLPREVRQRRVEDIELNARRQAQQQRFNTGPQRDGQTRPIFNRGSLTQQNVVEQPIYSKKVSFISQNTEDSAWPTKNGFTQSPPQRRLEEGNVVVVKERESLDDEVFLPSTPRVPEPKGSQGSQGMPGPSRDEIFLLNQQRQKELLLAKARSNGGADNVSVMDNASVISEVPRMRNIREPIYGTRQGQVNPNTTNESVYGTRVDSGRVINEPIYGSRNQGPRMNESPYGTATRNPSPNYVQNRNESPYGVRQNQESPYGSRPNPVQNENIYGSRGTPGAPVPRLPPPNRGMTESPYGTRPYPNGMPARDESIYGSKQSNMIQHDSVYGSRVSVQRTQEPIYGARPLPQQRMESPYGTRPNGQRYLPGYPPPGHQEPVYGSRPNPQNQNQEVLYGYRISNDSVRAESPYGTNTGRPPLPMGNQQYYNRAGSVRMGPATGGPPLPPGGPGRSMGMKPGLQRSNSLRQPESPEALYAGRPNFNKPPSGAQYRQRVMDLSPPQRHGEPPQGRYDFPPPDASPPRLQQQHQQSEPIYGRKVNTVNNKVCDMYGNIYDANKQIPMSPPPLQKAGVLYGQLQRNSNAPPVAYQSHQQLQPNFQRGTRLTASVNDMHRYNSNVNMVQRTEPPSRPLPPIPDEKEKKSRFGFGRKKNDAKGK